MSMAQITAIRPERIQSGFAIICERNGVEETIGESTADHAYFTSRARAPALCYADRGHGFELLQYGDVVSTADSVIGFGYDGGIDVIFRP